MSLFYVTGGVCPGNIHVYTNQGASYSQFYQPRRRRAYERREEVVEENRSQVSESQRTPTWFKVPMLLQVLIRGRIRRPFHTSAAANVLT